MRSHKMSHIHSMCAYRSAYINSFLACGGDLSLDCHPLPATAQAFCFKRNFSQTVTRMSYGAPLLRRPLLLAEVASDLDFFQHVHRLAVLETGVGGSCPLLPADGVGISGPAVG